MPPAPPFPRTRFIINPISAARHSDIEGLIRQESLMAGMQSEIVRTARAGHALEFARESVRDQVDLVVAVGGDGTVNEVANGLVGSETTLGILPLGTGNAFARAIGVPINPAAACRMLATAEATWVDAGRVGDRVFLSTMGVGVDAEVCRLFSGTAAGKRGFLRYAGLTVQAIKSYVPAHLTIDVDGRPWHQGAPLLMTVANTPQLGHGATIAPGAVPDDGWLDILFAERLGLLRSVWHARRLFTGSIDRMPGAQTIRARRIRIVRERPGVIQMDGESIAGDAILDVEVVPKALRVAVPGGAGSPS
jgi:diacylglycerol kinase (ATP)